MTYHCFLRRLARVAPALTLVASGAACDSLLGSDQAAFAADAHVRLSGTTPVPLLLITSTAFVARQDLDTGNLVTILLTADTLVLQSATFDQHFDIFGSDRFLVRVVNPDSAQTADVHLRVALDAREVYSQRATMRDASLEYTAYYVPGVY